MPIQEITASDGNGQFAGVARSGCDWQLSPTKRTEKTRLEYVGLTAPCPSALGHARSFVMACVIFPRILNTDCRRIAAIYNSRPSMSGIFVCRFYAATLFLYASNAAMTSAELRRAPVCKYSIALSAASCASQLEPATQSSTTRQ